ncbi:MAG: TetR/AcrR family transcriptional regulator, partial [Candidatus Omnitrophica bacterium]|nr:TetR/AcrR family transcriptional regulator [Candidatus Omnitrophota bacterium]
MKREDSGIHTRKRIINSALNVAARAGFSSATTKEIASGAKCSEGIIYHYFRGKNELFFAVIKESAEMFLGELDLQLRLAKNAEAKLI